MTVRTAAIVVDEEANSDSNNYDDCNADSDGDLEDESH